MRTFPNPMVLLLVFVLAGCQTSREHAVDVATAVFRSDRGDDVRELWIVEAGTQRKLEPLLEGASVTFIPHFSPTKEWLAVDEKLNEEFTLTRLFHQESSGGFRRIPEEEYILGAYNTFLLGFQLQDSDLAVRSVTFENWGRGGKDIVLRLEARTQEGKSFSTSHVIDLATLE